MVVAKLNGLKICAADITSAYLEAYTSELKYTVLGPELGPQWAGKRVKIDKALYGLIGSCSSFHSHLCKQLYKIGFRPSKADSDLWIREQDDHYEFVGKYSDDLLVMYKDPIGILKQLQKPIGPYSMKGIGTPEYYLGGDLHIECEGDIISKMSTNAKTYVKQITKKIETCLLYTSDAADE